MFSGIIEKQAKILQISDGRFTVENHFGTELKIGQSIAHDGACMTIENFNDTEYTFFAMQESLNLTNFGEKKVGDYFNVERCLQIGDRIDGHFVSGHIDTTGSVSDLTLNSDKSLILEITYPKDFSSLVVQKGSITINGTSLTIVKNEAGILGVSLIPLTQELTNLGKLTIGDKVNLELDMLGKYIKNLIPKN